MDGELSLSAPALRRQVEDLHTRYIRSIDDDRIEEWPNLFTPECLYKIVTRENFERGLPLAIMECRSRGMLVDRVTGLRRINVYEPQRYSHQVSGLVIEPVDENTAACRSNYLVVRTTGDGAMTLFSAGVYVDKVVIRDGCALFAERIVVQDSRRVETLLAIPL
ncbi:MAG TPA: aromatic-ring-hydroxylating dioxygenase subunit beta [Bryobacteraceae bacterium]|nr:aromatic-ring-hydroxylating dioxygenase subunit beta [Bryobacteraceae bacterium]